MFKDFLQMGFASRKLVPREVMCPALQSGIYLQHQLHLEGTGQTDPAAGVAIGDPGPCTGSIAEQPG